MTQAKRILDDNEADEDDRYFICHPEQIEQLLNDERFSSTDYNRDSVLYEGKALMYLGFTIKTVAPKSVPLPKTGNNRTNYFFQRKGIVYARNATTEVRLQERPDLDNLWQIWGEMNGDAVRVEEELVGRMICQEAA